MAAWRNVRLFFTWIWLHARGWPTVALLTLGVGGVQAYLMWRQTSISDRQADIAEKQTEVSERQATIMETQTGIQKDQTEIAKRQTEIALQGYLPVWQFSRQDNNGKVEPVCMIVENKGAQIRDAKNRAEFMLAFSELGGKSKYVHFVGPGSTEEWSAQRTGLLYFFDPGFSLGWLDAARERIVGMGNRRNGRVEAYVEISYTTSLNESRLDRYVVGYPDGYPVVPVKRKPDAMLVFDLAPYHKDKLDAKAALLAALEQVDQQK